MHLKYFPCFPFSNPQRVSFKKSKDSGSSQHTSIWNSLGIKTDLHQVTNQPYFHLWPLSLSVSLSFTFAVQFWLNVEPRGWFLKIPSWEWEWSSEHQRAPEAAGTQESHCQMYQVTKETERQRQSVRVTLMKILFSHLCKFYLKKLIWGLNWAVISLCSRHFFGVWEWENV